jgi:short-subunit dehydrogenase
MKKTVLITGASSGIGYELSKIFSKNGYNLLLVSENRQELEAAAEEIVKRHSIQVKAITKDLTEPSAPQELYDEIIADGFDIDVLVNNAGYGFGGKFTDHGTDEHISLIRLNIAALTILCRLFGADMVKKGSGSILNVASAAAFQAGPFMSTYYASKAYVLSFSEAIGNEFAGYGVNVTVLCPGPTQTHFIDRAGISDTKIANVPWKMNPAEVARIGYAGLMKGKRVVIPGFMNKFIAFSVRLIPRSTAVSISASLNQK